MAACFQEGSIDISPGDLSSPEPSDSLPDLFVMTAGLPRSGKSTSLNNIFDTNFRAKRSAAPVTDKVYKDTQIKNGISLTVIDTPGFQAANANNDESTKQEMEKMKKKNILLLLSLSVSPGTCLSKDYHVIIQNLTQSLGPDIWDWSTILLTFSDLAQNDSDSPQDYLEYLKGYCMELQTVLATNGVNKPVKLFDYNSFDQLKEENQNGIVAFPVGKTPHISTKRIFPLLPWTHEYEWTDLVYMEIVKLGCNIQLLEQEMRKEIEHQDILKREYMDKESLILLKQRQRANELRLALIQFKYGVLAGTMAGGSSGAVIGAVVGGAAGATIGPMGMCIGAAVGGVIGATAGSLSIGWATEAIYLIKIITDKKREFYSK